MPSSVFYNYHGAVIQISHRLIIFFSLFNEEEVHLLTGQNNRLERICKLIYKDSNFFNVVQTTMADPQLKAQSPASRTLTRTSSRPGSGPEG